MRKLLLTVVTSLAMVMTLAGCSSSQGNSGGVYTDGTYTGSADGMNGKVEVSVEVKDDAIVSVVVMEQQETQGIADPALETIPQAIVDANSTEVEAVSGATVTSNAIMSAVANALDKASGAIANEETPEASQQPLAFTDPDVIVVGGGFAGMRGPRFPVQRQG